VPLVNLHGVYILPGIPRLFKAMIEANKDPFKGPANKSRTLYTNTVEGDLAGITLRLLLKKDLPKPSHRLMATSCVV